MRFYCQLASEGIKREFTQGLFDLSNYTYEEKDGDQLVRQVKDSLGDYFRKKKVAAQVRNSKIFVIFLKQLLVIWHQTVYKVHLKLFVVNRAPKRLKVQSS